MNCKNKTCCKTVTFAIEVREHDVKETLKLRRKKDKLRLGKTYLTNPCLLSTSASNLQS